MNTIKSFVLVLSVMVGWMFASVVSAQEGIPFEVSVPEVPTDADTTPKLTLDTPALDLVFSGEGSLVLAPAAIHNRVDMWDLNTGTRYDMLFDHDVADLDGITEIIYYAESTDGSTMLSGDMSGRVVLWDSTLTEMGRLDPGFSDEFDSVFSVSPLFDQISIGGCLVQATATECSQWAVVVYSLADNTILHQINVGSSALTHLAYTPDGSYLGVADAAGIFSMYTSNSGELGAQLETVLESISTIRFSPVDNVLAVGGCEYADTASGECLLGSVDVFNYTDGNALDYLQAHYGNITSMDFDAFGVDLATAGADGAVRVWTLGEGVPHQTILTQAQVVRFVPGFPEIMSGGENGIQLWDLR
ncbi:MAG: WD40 repeat domain-containing protein [Phototrophicaceae bacterium]